MAAGRDDGQLRAKGTGTLEIRLGRLGARSAGTIEFSSTEMEEQTIEVDASRCQGVKNVFFVVTSADNFYVDAWQFADAQHDAINEVEGSKAINRQSYDLSGRKLSESDNHRGIIIEQYTDEKGVKHSRKRRHYCTGTIGIIPDGRVTHLRSR